MTLRIVEEAIARETVVALHGWLTAAEVGELTRVVAERGPCLRIDLARLAGADAEGMQALQRLRRDGAWFSGASPYIQLLLERTVGDGER